MVTWSPLTASPSPSFLTFILVRDMTKKLHQAMKMRGKEGLAYNVSPSRVSSGFYRTDRREYTRDSRLIEGMSWN